MERNYQQSELITAGMVTQSTAQAKTKNPELENPLKTQIRTPKRLDEQVRNSMSVSQFMIRQTSLYQPRGRAI
jgi:hypothetical protein